MNALNAVLYNYLHEVHCLSLVFPLVFEHEISEDLHPLAECDGVGHLAQDRGQPHLAGGQRGALVL